MKRKLIALDLDGTTLNNHSILTDRTADILQHLQKAGHIVSIATGRPYRNSKQYYEQLQLDTPIVNFNGALCHKPKELAWESQYHKTLDREIALDMLSLRKEMDIQLIAAELRDQVYIDDDFIPYTDFFPNEQQKKMKLSKDSLREEPTSVSVFTAKENQTTITERIIERYGDAVEVRTWGGHAPCLEVVAAGVQKALGVERIASVYHIQREDILAFGDEANDYEMIQYAGHGVAMSNGIEELKAVANDVTTLTNHENGLAHYLKKYFKLSI